jgi:hypothetical protein
MGGPLAVFSSHAPPAQAGTPNLRDARGFGVPASAGGAEVKFTVRFCGCAHPFLKTEMGDFLEQLEIGICPGAN